MSTQSQYLHLTEFCAMKAFSERVPFFMPRIAGYFSNYLYSNLIPVITLMNLNLQI